MPQAKTSQLSTRIWEPGIMNNNEKEGATNIHVLPTLLTGHKELEKKNPLFTSVFDGSF